MVVRCVVCNKEILVKGGKGRKYCSLVCNGAGKVAPSLADAFFKHVGPCPNDIGECWIWKGKQAGGYGTFKYKTKWWLAHRVSYMLFVQSPRDDLICHSCDNPLCVNPYHLFQGTVADNTHDMLNKGRGKIFGHDILNEHLVRQIRSLYQSEQYTQQQLAQMFNKTQVTISHIVNHKTWRHIL